MTGFGARLGRYSHQGPNRATELGCHLAGKTFIVCILPGLSAGFSVFSSGRCYFDGVEPRTSKTRNNPCRSLVSRYAAHRNALPRWTNGILAFAGKLAIDHDVEHVLVLLFRRPETAKYCRLLALQPMLHVVAPTPFVCGVFYQYGTSRKTPFSGFDIYDLHGRSLSTRRVLRDTSALVHSTGDDLRMPSHNQQLYFVAAAFAQLFVVLVRGEAGLLLKHLLHSSSAKTSTGTNPPPCRYVQLRIRRSCV